MTFPARNRFLHVPMCCGPKVRYSGRCMASVNPHTRELVFKLVFYGPGLGGKTTTLQYIHAATRPENKGKMVSLATPTDRTLYFDFLPVRVPKVNGMSIRLQLFTVPGQVYYEATRKLVLSGADGVVFVADSQSSRLETNQESLEDLETSLADHQRTLKEVPHTFHWNKQDLSDLVSMEALNRRYNKHGAPSIGTVATRGDGVFDGLERITGLVLSEYGKEDSETIRAGVREAFKSLVGTGTTVEPPAQTVASKPPAQAVASKPPAQPKASAKPSAKPEKIDPVVKEREPAKPVADDEVAPETVGRPLAVAAGVARSSSQVPSFPSQVPSSAGSSPRPPTVEAKLFSFIEMFAEAERDSARKVELFLGIGDPHGAILASESLLTRVFASAAAMGGSEDAPRDPAMVSNLLGCDGRTYLAMRGLARAARQREQLTLTDAFEFYIFVLDARRRRDEARRFC